MRLILILFNRSKTKRALITNLPGNVIRVVFEMEGDKKLLYQSGQYIFICIPAISWYEWKPFSISSSPHEDEFALHLSVQGKWTTQLKKAIEQNGKPLSKKQKKSEREKTKTNMFRRMNTIHRGNSNPKSFKQHNENLNQDSLNPNQSIEEALLKDPPKENDQLLRINTKIKFKPKNFEIAYIPFNFFKSQKYWKTPGNSKYYAISKLTSLFLGTLWKHQN